MNDNTSLDKDRDYPIDKIARAAEIYGQRSFDNYAQIRSIAEMIRDGFCQWLSPDHQCVFLVPPDGPFNSENYRSAAFSVSGKGYLPLKPISFGLAIRISKDQDFMRLKLTCSKEGDSLFINIEGMRDIRMALPIDDNALTPLFEALYQHIYDFFALSVDEYDNGDYGSTEIGFDIMRISE